MHLSPTAEISVIETTQFKIATILEGEPDNKRSPEHWALKAHLLSAVTHARTQTETLTPDETKELLNLVNRKIAHSTKQLISRGILPDDIIRRCGLANIENVLKYLQSSKIWLFCLFQLSEIPDVFDHSVEIMLTSMLFGLQHGFSEERLVKVAVGALLHDVGHIFIDRSISRSPDTDFSMEDRRRAESDLRKRLELHTAF